VNLAGSAKPTAELARGYADMSVFAGYIPLPRVAGWYARPARMTAEEVGDLSTLAWTSIPTSVFRIGRGHWGTIERALGEALEISERLPHEKHRADQELARHS
jgi:hypothetical protein